MRADEGGYTMRQRVGLFLGPATFLLMLLTPAPGDLSMEGWRTAAVAALMSVFWITEALPISATALLPLVLLPVLGVFEIEAAASPYANSVIFLFMGGFMLAKGMQRWNLQRRVALWILAAVGTRPTHLIGGMMIATAVISMWVSNTATTVMMLPIGLSIIELLMRHTTGSHAVAGAGGSGASSSDMRAAEFATALMLGIAYAASVGGLGTIVGTPPNALLVGYMRETYGVSIGFGQWMLLGIPLVVVALPLTWLLVTRLHPVKLDEVPGGRALISGELRALGQLTRGEITVGAVFFATTTLWITRPQLVAFIPQLSDAGIAVAAALALFLIPVDWKRGVFALDWQSARQIPWDVLLLFGGGLSLAAAMTRTGLANSIGAGLSGLDRLPLFVLIGAVATAICLLSELASNTATAAAFLPVASAIAIGIGENPFLITVPAALAASLGFMLPVATPPNAIAYGTGHITAPQMARAGVLLDIICILLVTVAAFALLGVVFGVEMGVVPSWAR